MRTIAERVKARREELGLSRPELAAAAGISISYLRGIETNNDRPGRDKLDALARALKVEVDYLLHGRGAPVPTSAKLVDDPDKLALLRFWDGLEDDQRAAVLNLLLSMRPAA